MKKATERIFIGIRALRESLSEYVAIAREGVLVVIRGRDKKIQAVLTSEGVLEDCNSADPLPPEFYAAYHLQREAAIAVMLALSRSSYPTAQRIASAAEEIEVKDRRRKEKSLGQQELDIPVKRIKDEKKAIEEGKANAEAKAKARAERAKQLQEEKLAETMLRDSKPYTNDDLSIRRSLIGKGDKKIH